MSDFSARYARLAATMTERVSGVRDDQWENPSPCAKWTARDLVRHLVDTHAMFGGFVELTMQPGPDAADDPVGAWSSARDQMQAWLDDPAVAEKEFQGLGGPTTLQVAADRFLGFDLLVHGWDLATATGQDDTIDPAELPRLWEDTEAFGEQIRSEGTCGPELTPPPQATEQDKLLAYLGRDPRGHRAGRG
jgi:uncharacterized protein (TIGR03086 family)